VPTIDFLLSALRDASAAKKRAAAIEPVAALRL
jgi:hypothetical protein